MNLATISPILFVAGAFTLATVLEPIWSGMQRRQARSVLDLMVGDGKRLFANHFVAKADVYFHNGYYPSIFEQAKADSHLSEAAESNEGHDEHEGHDHGDHSKCDHDGDGKPDGEKQAEKEVHKEHKEHEGHDHDDHSQCDHDGDGKPDGEKDAKASEATNFIEAFGRHFFVSKHTHMKNTEAKELLPWFKISAELDPNRIETYTVAAYWLRATLKKVDEAEAFLRQGWKSNPDSYAIIFELGRLYEKDRNDYDRARNLWELALKKWDQQEKGKEQPDNYGRQQILAHLVEVEYRQGAFRECLEHLQQLEPISPYPETIRKHIEDVRGKLSQQK